ncbi:hypothetical protein WBK31_16275 [Nonomuraea sp. N2-4H]|uniref:hypothetical protein n=1 Tax=Nonomuraea sp. N2-4H TaxID=3128898 RepID=UPI003247B557
MYLTFPAQVGSGSPPSRCECAGGVLGEDGGCEAGSQLPSDARAQAAEQERHARTVGARPGGRGDRVGAEQELVGVAGVGEGREAVQQAPVGAVVCAGRTVERQEGSGRRGLPVDPGVREAVARRSASNANTTANEDQPPAP